MIDFANLVQGSSLLQIDFFWNFQRFQTAEEEVKEAEMLVDKLLMA